VVKIDIEGNEHRAFVGAEQSIFANKVPYIAIELIDKHLHDRGSSATELLRLLRSHGYMISVQGFQGPFLNWDDLMVYPRRFNLDDQVDYFLVHSSHV
jgi:hypothetical protein